jgi:hypothetical protein
MTEKGAWGFIASRMKLLQNYREISGGQMMKRFFVLLGFIGIILSCEEQARVVGKTFYYKLVAKVDENGVKTPWTPSDRGHNSDSEIYITFTEKGCKFDYTDARGNRVGNIAYTYLGEKNDMHTYKFVVGGSAGSFDYYLYFSKDYTKLNSRNSVFNSTQVYELSTPPNSRENRPDTFY